MEINQIIKSKGVWALFSFICTSSLYLILVFIYIMYGPASGAYLLFVVAILLCIPLMSFALVTFYFGGCFHHNFYQETLTRLPVQMEEARDEYREARISGAPSDEKKKERHLEE